MSNGLEQEHYTGAATEMRAAAFYLKQGYQVYFPVVKQSHVDFVIEKAGRFQRVQVKTATWVRSGKHSYLQARTRLTNKHQEKEPADIYDLFVVVHGSNLWEIPAGEIDSSNLSLMRSSGSSLPIRWEPYRKALH
jgi:hypothetical protein